MNASFRDSDSQKRVQTVAAVFVVDLPGTETILGSFHTKTIPRLSVCGAGFAKGGRLSAWVRNASYQGPGGHKPRDELGQRGENCAVEPAGGA